MTDTPPVRRWPVVPTLIVLLAILIMIALGVWQWQRKAEKEAVLALYERNLTLSGDTAFPAVGPVPDTSLFRRSAVTCIDVAGWRVLSGRAVGGMAGFRFIAECRTGAEGPGALIDMGVGTSPAPLPTWQGGTVSGIIGLDPQQGSALGQLFTRPPPPRAMLVAATPAPGLMASAPPDPQDVPNNHLAYAVQWWLFAAGAAVIFWLAVRARWRRGTGSGPPRS